MTADNPALAEEISPMDQAWAEIEKALDGHSLKLAFFSGYVAGQADALNQKPLEQK